MRVRTLVGTIAAVALVSFAVEAPVASGQEVTPTHFDFTGAAQSYTVPATVCSVTVLVAGASGGSFRGVQGSGGTAQATLPVTPGQVLSVTVGGFGGSAANSPANDGGWPNGGSGGQGATGGDGPLFWAGGGGGGSSDVRTVEADPTTRLLVGGGGGGAAFDLNDDTLWQGGDGGGLTGTDGAGGAGFPTPASPGGKGGTQSAPGAGGTSDGTDGDPGVDIAGGNGGDSTSGGGGGGGGYFGGGGGAGAILSINRGAGGGGSGFGPAGTVFGVNAVAEPTDGFVEITPAANSCVDEVAVIARFAG